MSFYRTYRPQTIADIDNAAVREHLLQLLHKDTKDLPHAYLFTGPKGAGKTTAARVIAKLYNCTHPTKNGPCGACETCRSIASGTCLDVIEMDAASNRGIDEIRQLRDRIGLAPASSAYTIYIIDEVHMLTTEAFNALLKTIEEPPAHAVFILATTDREKVPDTIQSRCITITFGKAAKEELVHALERIAKSEKIDISSDAMDRVAYIADGSFRDAVKYLEQLSFSKGEIDRKTVDSALALSDVTFRASFLEHLAAKDSKAVLADISRAVSDGRDMKALLTDVLSDLEIKLVAAVTGTPDGVWTVEALGRAVSSFTRAYRELRYSPIPRLPVELAAVEYCAGIMPLPQEAGPAMRSSAPTKVPQPEPGPKKQSGEAPAEKQTNTQDSPVKAPGLLTIEKLREHWRDFIAAAKPYNHSVAGVLRSTRPKSVEDGIVTIEAFYTFHQEKLNESKTQQILADLFKKLFGVRVKVKIVLGKK